MSKTRNNHYVPQWYQEGFFEEGENTLAYLDLTPSQKVLADGRIITERAQFEAPTSRAFRQKDLYSTFFGTSVNDEIERRLFGDIDARGSIAVRAFLGNDVAAWQKHFQTLFEYIDIQKLRTPKGLDWLKAQYPALTQNDLMFEMQGIRAMHCTIWTEGVREIVSATGSDVKFIATDHPVTIYNYSLPPSKQLCSYPSDPTIALKASQTIFPLSRDFCLILTNLEYAKDPSTPPLEKRTFPRNYRNSMVRTDAFIRTRNLSENEVLGINFILKKRARRYIAAGRTVWLHPENDFNGSWEDLKQTLLPPSDELLHFGGELIAKFEDGRVHYQDEFGRTEKQRDFLKKATLQAQPHKRELCGCGSGLQFGLCCNPKPAYLRPSWAEKSIRERNLILYNGIVDILGLHSGADWTTVRKNVTDEKIKDVYKLFEALWPLETDLLQLLPKPDGTARAVYTGIIHPTKIIEFALGATLYFGQLLIEHPFMHPGTVKDEFSPTKNPSAFRHEFLKATRLCLTVMPLVDSGQINLVPDPCNFDFHLRDQMLQMATARNAHTNVDPSTDAGLRQLMKDDLQRTLMALPNDALKSQLLRAGGEIAADNVEQALADIQLLREHDPLAVLQDSGLPDGVRNGQFNLVKLSPNFEIAMYLSQATGASLVTDSVFRWNEMKNFSRRTAWPFNELAALSESVESTVFCFPQDVFDIHACANHKSFQNYEKLMSETLRYLNNRHVRAMKPNVERHLNSKFINEHMRAQILIKKSELIVRRAKISCFFPTGGIQNNTVNRLLLMSSSEHHWQSVPMAFFIKDETPA